MKLGDLNRLISEIMREQREEPGLSSARSEQAYRRGKYGSSRRPASRQLKKARRRQGDREIRFAVDDVDGDGDLDLVNLGYSEISSGSEMDEIVRILASRGIIDDSNAHIFSEPRRYEDPRLGGESPDGPIDAFLSKLAIDAAYGDEERLTYDDIERLSDLSYTFNSAIQGGYDDISDQMRRDEFLDDDIPVGRRLSDEEGRARFSESKENNMGNRFGREDLKAFFAQTLYEDFETSKPRRRRGKQMLTEALEDHSLPPLDQDERNRLAQAIVTGINLEFDINASGPALVELEEQVQYHLAKHPGLPAILFDIAMEAVLDDSGEDDDRAGAVFGMPPASEYGSHIEFDAFVRDKILDQVATKVYDAMDSGSLNAGVLDELVDAMIDANEIDADHWHKSAIDVDEVRDRVAEIEEENIDITGL